MENSILMPALRRGSILRSPASIGGIENTCGDKSWVDSEGRGWIFRVDMLVPERYPLDEFFHGPALLQFLFCLEEVASVGPEEGFFVRDEGDGIGSAEAGDEFDSLVFGADVLTLMLVGAWEEVEVPVAFLHQGSDLCEFIAHQILFKL